MSTEASAPRRRQNFTNRQKHEICVEWWWDYNTTQMNKTNMNAKLLSCFLHCFPLKFDWCSCNYVIFCNDLKASDWNLEPPFGHFNSLTSNICMTTVDGNASIRIFFSEFPGFSVRFGLDLDGNQAGLLKPVFNFVWEACTALFQ